MNIVTLIPAYNPAPGLVDYVKQLGRQFQHVVIVNDGSKSSCESIFQQLSKIKNVHVLKHAVNQGKGAALKTGLNYVELNYTKALGVVTVDADGQHQYDDVIRVAKALEERPAQLIIGSRAFSGKVPFRSRFGNSLTRKIFRLMTGIKIQDTQTGLRGVPFSLIPSFLKIRSGGYEFELDMLLISHRLGIKIFEVMIQTVYIDNNASSHFRPLVDSLKIYFVLFRFAIIAMISGLIDYTIFFAMYYLVIHKVFICLVTGRVISMIFNYINVRRFAFHSHETHKNAFPKYIVLVIFSALLAYALITGLMTDFGFNVVAAKIVSELIMFFVNFLVQRDFIFRKK